MSLIVTKQSQARDRFVFAGRSFTARELHQTAAIACGGNVTPGYFALLDLQISEFIFHCEVIEDARRIMHPDPDAKQTGMTPGGDFNWIE